MKVYQLVAVGQLAISGKQIMAHDGKAYRKEDAAKAAMPALRKLVTTPQKGNEMMAMSDNIALRIFTKVLEIT